VIASLPSMDERTDAFEMAIGPLQRDCKGGAVLELKACITYLCTFETINITTPVNDIVGGRVFRSKGI